MSGRKKKEKRRLKKIQAVRYGKELDSMEVKLWLKHKLTNPHVQCNVDFQEKIDRIPD